ncbi:MAG TPA: helix-turn-helix transcriptional regulator [Solirubrobacterales bacterium]|nr:helix-turn-helix transcriptional regulator [Solirubrobacterales bacterium]
MPANSEPDPALGAAVRQLRHSAGLRQEDLAHRAGVHFSTLRRIETGKADPTLSTLRRVADGLGVTLAEVVLLAERIRD